MSCPTSVSAPSTPTEQAKQIHSNVSLKKGKRNSRVHFPSDDRLVTCYLEPPDPWSKVYAHSINTLITSYVAACDKHGIKPLHCILDQIQEYESNSYKLESNPRAFDLCILGEKLSIKHCEALEEVLRRLQFNLIDLEGCYLEDEGAAAFFDMIEYYDSAVQLNISFTKHIDCRGWQACTRMLKKTTSLVHLNARSTGMNEQVLLIIGRALRLGSNLVTLHLENCGIFGRCLVILVVALKLNTTLRELFLAENKISSADGFQLGNLLRTNTHLELLDLSNNKLGDDGLVHLMESLGQQSNTSGRGLSTLILWNNELTVKSMPCISRALTAARALKRLNLGSNAITDLGILEIKQSLICNRTIEILELENADITSEGAVALSEYISQNQFIQKLDLCGNNVKLDGLKSLSRALAKNSNITSVKVDPTSSDLNEPIKERQEELLEISKFCQRNKEAKSSLPPQDAQLSTLFNGIFSRVIPPAALADGQMPDDKAQENSSNFSKGRFRVSVVLSDQENIASRNTQSVSVATSCYPAGYKSKSHHTLVQNTSVTDVNRVKKDKDLESGNGKWLKDLSNTQNINNRPYSNLDNKSLLRSLETNSDEVFSPENESTAKGIKPAKVGLSLPLSSSTTNHGSEQKVRRLSSPTVSIAPSLSRKTHSIKCCKELEGLDLRSTVPLSPTRLHETFDFPQPEVTEVSLNEQLKSSHTVYMVH